MMTVMMMTLTSIGRQGMRVNHQDCWWPRKNHTSRAQLSPQSTESYQSSTSLTRQKEPCWAIVCWTGLQRRRRRSTRRGCRETGETPQVQSGDRGSEGHSSLSENHSTSDPQAALPEVGERDHPGLQDRPVVPVGGDTVSPGSSGGIPCQVVR